MKHQQKAILVALLGACAVAPIILAEFILINATTTHAENVATSTPATSQLTHAQTVWKYALEWCESNGIESAVNPKDRDGTPSYYSFQFKPGTFEWLEEKYGVTGPITSWDSQSAILEHMIEDASVTPYEWRHEYFPGCTAKLGTPPQST